MHALQNGERKGSISDRKDEEHKTKADNRSAKYIADDKEYIKNTTGISVTVTSENKTNQIVKTDVPKSKEEQKVEKKHIRKPSPDEEDSQKFDKILEFDDPPHSSRIMEEIFTTSARSYRSLIMELDAMGKEEERKSSISDTKPPLPKERLHTPSVTPRSENASVKAEGVAHGDGKDKKSAKKEEAKTKVIHPSSTPKLSKLLCCRVAVASLIHVMPAVRRVIFVAHALVCKDRGSCVKSLCHLCWCDGIYCYSPDTVNTLKFGQ